MEDIGSQINLPVDIYRFLATELGSVDNRAPHRIIQFPSTLH